MTTLTVVTFEPRTLGFYIDGEFDGRGESYMEGQILRDYIESEQEFDKTSTRHYDFDGWDGMPSTLEECEEMYGTE